MFLRKCTLLFISVLSVNARQNIALRKPTKQSTILDGGASYRAVDGNTYGVWEGGSCILTDRTPYTWWCVDLQHIYSLSEIKVFSQKDYENMSGFKLSLSSRGGCDESGSRSASSCYIDDGRSEYIYNIHGCNTSSNTDFTAKTIYISRGHILGFCEVEIFSDSCPPTLYGSCKDGTCNSTTGECIECAPGHYGNLCQKRCKRCRTCRQADGECNFDCIDGFWGRHCEKDCSSFCLHGLCDSLSGICKGCHPGRYGDLCDQTCPECGLSCQQSDGTCKDACNQTTWGPLCEHRCSNRCKNELCHSVTGRCYDCVAHYYGNMCENTCYSCKASCDQTSGVCTDGCVEGVWGRYCKNNCPVTCNPGGCSRSDGMCVNGCRKGWHQPNCDAPCSEYCLGGCRQMDGVCNTCLTGRYGPYCKRSCSNCKHGGCTRSMGVCFAGCISGAWGANCTSTCGERCKNGCLQSSGECVNCVMGTYSNFCSAECLNCNEDGCRRADGVCYTGCRIGWYGDRCDKECNFRCRDGCQRSDGACKECMEGLYGTKCEVTCSVGCEDSGCSREDGSCRCKPGFSGKTCDVDDKQS